MMMSQRYAGFWVATMSEYMHNDDVAELLHAKEVEIRDLKKQISLLLSRLAHLRTELSRVETDYARGF